jgi:hypothetical protein
MHGVRRFPGRHQRGTTAVEFAILAMLFFTLVFGIFEVARLMYAFNTLHIVTRRVADAAANVYPLDTVAIQNLKQAAIFRDSPGELLLAPPVTDAHIRIEYLALTRSGNTGALNPVPIARTSLPATAARHRQICMNNPNASNCVRLIQVSICDPGTSSECAPVLSRMLLPLLDLQVALHKARTIATVESLGYVPGTSPCPCP